MTRLSLLRQVLLGLGGTQRLPANSLQPARQLSEVVGWIERANGAVGGKGISKGFDLVRNRWAPTYPETTGYSIPTLLNLAQELDRPDLRRLALSLADYLLGCITPEGGVAHWQETEAPQPVVFDTGQVLFGWLAAYESSQDERYLQAAIRAGDWLASVQDPSGSWKKFQHLGVEKVIDARVSWALLELHQRVNQENHLEAAMRNLDWVLQRQEANGWFRQCAFRDGEDPFTHTIAYTAEGLFECGCITGEARYIEAGQRTADALLALQRVDGSLASTYDAKWRETSRSSCLTGNCQMAHLWIRLYRREGREEYLKAARNSIAFVARTQNLSTTDLNIRGAIAGSYPIYGRYERLKYPNWAAKFFADSLLALQDVSDRGDGAYHVG